ncbi:MAG: Na+/H+ antiporter [Firmicutes bacterium]|nr:Na+/H+ antiporter [Bacillota bacterium]
MMITHHRRLGATIMYGTVWSLLPFGVVLAVAVRTRQVLVGLLMGLLAGAFMLRPSPLAAVESALRLLLEQLAVPDNIRLMVFLYGFGAFVGLLRATGGVTGFARWMEHRANSVRSGFLWTWLSCAFTFMAPDFRIMAVAPMMEDVFRRLKVPADRVALLIEATATPLTAVIPIGTVFVGYMVSLIAAENRNHGLSVPPLRLVMQSIPFNFVAWVLLAFAFYQSFVQRPVQSRVRPEPVRSEQPNPLRLACAEPSGELVPEQPAQNSAPDPIKLLVPLAALLFTTLLVSWWQGHYASRSFLGALTQADPGHAMLVALFVTLVGSTIWFVLRGQRLGQIVEGVLAGGNEMMSVNTLLVLVWTVTAASRGLGFTEFITALVLRLVSPALTVPILFAFSCVVAYVIGSTFGAWGLLLPIGYSLAAAGQLSLPLIVGAVFAGGTFGGFASPFSDNTVTMATVMKLPVLDYARTKLTFGVIAALVSLLLYIGVGWLTHRG